MVLFLRVEPGTFEACCSEIGLSAWISHIFKALQMLVGFYALLTSVVTDFSCILNVGKNIRILISDSSCR